MKYIFYFPGENGVKPLPFHRYPAVLYKDPDGCGCVIFGTHKLFVGAPVNLIHGIDPLLVDDLSEAQNVIDDIFRQTKTKFGAHEFDEIKYVLGGRVL